MIQALIPAIVSAVAAVASKNNPQASNTLNSALQIYQLFGKGGAKLPNKK